MFENFHELLQLKTSFLQHSRNHRLHQSEGYWYFNTREGIKVGPFTGKADASYAANFLAKRSEWPDSEQLSHVKDGLELIEKKH